ncbi:MAG: hypothetical protein IKO52_00720 [Clostridia bacterium]|nr:hypothetical protein [Clostridia bacterium]
MADYCGECARWVSSSDIDGDGRRWCAYSRKYEEANQIIYGCRGFVFNGCIVLIRVCEILNEPKEKWLEVYETVKEIFAAPEHMEWLSAYFSLGPQIADGLDADDQRDQLANELMKEYMQPAYTLWQEGNIEQSAMVYREMVSYLANQYLRTFFIDEKGQLKETPPPAL